MLTHILSLLLLASPQGEAEAGTADSNSTDGRTLEEILDGSRRALGSSSFALLEDGLRIVGSSEKVADVVTSGDPPPRSREAFEWIVLHDGGFRIRYAPTPGGERLRVGFDGRRVWATQGGRDGLVERSEWEDLIMVLWLAGGAWASPGQLEWELESADSDRAVLGWRRSSGRARGRLVIDLGSDLPDSATIAGTPPVRVRFDAWRQVGGIAIPGRLRVQESPHGTPESVLEVVEPATVGSRELTEAPEGLPCLSFPGSGPVALDALRSPSGFWMLEGRVGEHRGVFLLDSGMGSGAHLIDSSLADAWDLPVTGQGEFVGVSGQGQKGEVFDIDAMGFGPVTLEGHRFLEADLSRLRIDEEGTPPGGILGLSFFNECVVELDPRTSKLVLYPFGSPPTPTSPWHDAPVGAGPVTLEARIEGHRAILEVDTCSSSAILLRHGFIEKHGLLEGRETRRSEARDPWASIPIEIGILRRVEALGHVFSEVPTQFSVGASPWASSDKDAGILGIRALEELTIWIDAGRGRIAWTPHR